MKPDFLYDCLEILIESLLKRDYSCISAHETITIHRAIQIAKDSYGKPRGIWLSLWCEVKPEKTLQDGALESISNTPGTK